MNEVLLNHGWSVARQRMVWIADVPSGSSHLVCPECGTQLIAAKGKMLQHHFRHKSNVNCVGAVETSYHKMAKQIICDNLAALILPDRYVHGTPISAQAEPPKEKRQKWLRDIQIIPDVLIEYESEPIAVEVYVAHRDPAKAAKYEQAGMAAFEINLSLHRHLLLGGSEFRNLVLRGAQSYWLNPPRIVREQRSEAARLAAEEQERQRILAAERSARELEWQREQNRLEAERLRQANERRAKLRLEQQEQQRLLDEQRHEADRLREQQKLDSETTFQRLGRGLSDREKEMLLAKARRRPYSGSENPWQFLFGYKVG